MTAPGRDNREYVRGRNRVTVIWRADSPASCVPKEEASTLARAGRCRPYIPAACHPSSPSQGPAPAEQPEKGRRRPERLRARCAARRRAPAPSQIPALRAVRPEQRPQRECGADKLPAMMIDPHRAESASKWRATPSSSRQPPPLPSGRPAAVATRPSMIGDEAEAAAAAPPFPLPSPQPAWPNDRTRTTEPARQAVARSAATSASARLRARSGDIAYYRTSFARSRKSRSCTMRNWSSGSQPARLTMLPQLE
jgi:hypothetical protein